MRWWPFVGERIAEALRRGGGGTQVEEVRRDLEQGLALLWVALEGAGLIIGVAVTMLVSGSAGKRCELVAFAGELERCRDMLPVLERYAAAEGCGAMRVIGRPGWRRALPGYAEPFVTLEKRF
jgi:hypothetical protein